jgi:hypothetical protein
MEIMPTTPAGIIGNLVARNLSDPDGQPVDPPSPVVGLIRSTTEAISTGGDITPYKDLLRRVTSNQAEKNDLVMAQLDEFDAQSIPRLVELVDTTEREIVAAARRGDLSATETMTIWRIAKADLTAMRDKREKLRGQSTDSVTAVEKIDLSRQTVERSVAIKWEHTTPQGRELIRKGLWELKQQISGAKPALNVESSVSTPALNVESSASTPA